MSVATRGGNAVSGRLVAGGYVRPPVRTYTDACEAPPAMWQGSIPLKRVRKVVNGAAVTKVEKTYHHPPELAVHELTTERVNSMYCMGNDTLIATYPEGLGGKVMQLMPPGHPRGWLYRKQSHLLNLLISKLPFYHAKGDAIKQLTAGRPGVVFDGATGVGKSALMCQAVHYARARGVMTVYVPSAQDWTHGEWCWPSTILPGFFDAPDASRRFLQYFARAHRAQLVDWPLTCTPRDLPVEPGEKVPRNLFELCEWGHTAVAPASVDRQSVAIKYVMDELMSEKKRPILFVVDGVNLFAHETHFRYPHPDFLRSMGQLGEHTDIDLYPQELPRIPSARLTFVRALNKMMLSADANKLFIGSTTRDFKPFDGGISGFPDPDNDKFSHSLDEYAPFDAAKDTILHPMPVGDFDEYEYRIFLRFLINSGELAGFGWGPMWHYSSSFERKLQKIEFMSERNPQRVIDHYHQEIAWRWEYERLRQKQFLTNRQSRLKKL